MISVCMAVYNGEKYLGEQLRSILPQLSDVDEVVISDDASSDATVATIKAIDDPRVKLVVNEGNHGFKPNFENALRHASGDLIFLSDQDDIWLPDKVKRAQELIEGYDMLVHNADLIDGNGNRLGKDYFSTLHRHTGFLWNLYKTRFLGCCMVFRRSLLEASLPFPEKVVAHDYWIGMLGLKRYKVRFTEEILMSYRRHGDNVSTSSGESDHSLFYKLFTKRFNLLQALRRRR